MYPVTVHLVSAAPVLGLWRLISLFLRGTDVHLLRGALAPLLCGVLAVSVAPASAVTSTAPTSAAMARSAGTAPALRTVATTQAAQTAQRKAPYRVTPGISFNSPIGSHAVKWRIMKQILGAINHAKPRSEIKIMSWNMMSADAVTALLKAQKRGVVVRLLMDASNDDADTPNPWYHRLKKGLRDGNGHKRPQNRSYAKTCHGSCRGKAGAAHAKYYLFSHSGASKHVFMQGSANLTTAAAINQWNELYTFVDNKGIYDFAERVFDQAWRDKPVRAPYESYGGSRVKLVFSPYAGRSFSSDPVQDALNAVKCRGAVASGNTRHRTIVRSAPDVIRGKRGMIAARQLKRLWNRGCDVRIVYTVMGGDVRKVLKSPGGRGAVPMRHLVQDFDGDGEFDNYFHIKVLTINGVMGKDRTSFLSFNGSSNTSDLATRSDENIGRIASKRVVLRYQEHIDYWFENPPPDPCDNIHEPGEPTCHKSGTGGGGGAAGRKHAVDPYAHVDLD